MTRTKSIAEIVAEECRSQGLPLKVEDPAALRAIAALVTKPVTA